MPEPAKALCVFRLLHDDSSDRRVSGRDLQRVAKSGFADAGH